MGKFDLGDLVNTLKKQAGKNNPRLSSKIGMGSELKTLEDKNFVLMPEWWRQATNTPGIPFGKLVMLAGDSDSGKTSAAIEAIKSALEQNCGVIYVETEGKTTPQDFEAWGVDPTQVLLIQSSVAEEAFELLFAAWDGFKDKYPETNLLVVFDSIGNVVSQRDAEINLTESSQKPGGKGQINRLGLSKMVSKRDQDNVAVLLINYTYDNIGSPGKTNAGGKSLNFFSCLTYQTSRKRWLEATVKGKKVRKGAEVVWKLFKNHLDKSNPGPKEITLQITKDGIKYAGGDEGAEE